MLRSAYLTMSANAVDLEAPAGKPTEAAVKKAVEEAERLWAEALVERFDIEPYSDFSAK